MRRIGLLGTLALGAAGVVISTAQAQPSGPPPTGGLLEPGSVAKPASNVGIGAVQSTPAQIRDSTQTPKADVPTPTANTPANNDPTSTVSTPTVNVHTPTVRVPTVNVHTPTVV